MSEELRNDLVALERWVNEGGREASRTLRAPRVVIAGAGVAGLETALALKASLSPPADVTIVAPEAKFVNRAMAGMQPFTRQRVRGVRLEPAAAELGARFHRGVVDRVDVSGRVVVTRDRVELPYDYLVLALGARTQTHADPDRVLVYRDGRDAAAYRLLLGRLRRSGLRRLAFVKPAGPTWPLPLYGLALMTAADCASTDTPIEISLFTPEKHPLELFGRRAAAGVRELLERHAIALHTDSHEPTIRADAVVTLPELAGPRIRGVPCTSDGFIRVDAWGRVLGCGRVYAVGDATDYPVKQGGIAAQQADAAASAIARDVGANVEPQPFRPVLRAALLTGGRPRYLQADISGSGDDDSTISVDPLWWPPNKLCARYLGAYLSGRRGEELDVMPRRGSRFDRADRTGSGVRA